MDKLKKLLQRISVKDRQMLLVIVNQLLQNKLSGLNIIKIKNTDFLRLRKGKFRIIFHNENGDIVIDSIRLRNKNTYKNL